jgi:hypothetical protein
MIAEYMIRHPEKVSYQHQDDLAGVQKQWSFLNMLKKQNTQLRNQLESLVYCANPELLVYCKDGFPQWVLKLLKRYPTAKKLSRAKVSSVAGIPYITPIRAKELIENAKYSIASSNDKATEQVIEATVGQCIQLKKVIEGQTKLLEQNCTIPEVKLLTTFIGLGTLSAIGLMLEIKTVNRFSSAKKIASYFGLHPVYKQSGDGLSGYKMSKRGRKEPRKILFMVTLSAIRDNPLIRDVYENRVKQGMNKMAAIGLCMHKILRIIYGMLKRNMAFDAEIDRANQEKFKSKAGENRIAAIRRVQGFDTKAPISRRQDKKRKEQRESQGVNAPSAGSSPPFLQIDNMTMNSDYKQNIR